MTPRELGYRMPAEWGPHRATWVSWPHNRETWPEQLESTQQTFACMIAALAQSETVHVNVNHADMEESARRHAEQAGARRNVEFHHFPTNDAWCRDHGAIFVTRDSSESRVAATDWEYNAWGGKYPPYHLDNKIPRQMAGFLDVPIFEGGMVLEAGSIDVNGDGLLLTTESCLLNPNRNPHLNREQIEQRLRDFLGVETILWLGDGIAGDDTDGHVDDFCRFVAPDTIVIATEDDPNDVNHLPLQESRDRLHSLIDDLQLPLKVIALPMPPAIVQQGERLPASYANFYIGNNVVLLPGYDTEQDQQAAEVLQPLFPDREIVTIDCTNLIWGLGAFHCLTQQVPA